MIKYVAAYVLHVTLVSRPFAMNIGFIVCGTD